MSKPISEQLDNILTDQRHGFHSQSDSHEAILNLIAEAERRARIDELKEVEAHADRIYPECDEVLDHIANRLAQLGGSDNED